MSTKLLRKLDMQNIGLFSVSDAHVRTRSVPFRTYHAQYLPMTMVAQRKDCAEYTSLRSLAS